MKTRILAVAVAATLGLGSISAFAQDHHWDRRGQGTWQHQQQQQHQRFEQRRGDWAYGNRYVAPRYYAPSYNYGRDDGDVAGALMLGAVAGALLGQASNAYAPPPTYYAPPPTYYSPPATYYAPPTTYYAPPSTVYNPTYGYGYNGY
jgi:hypothetical protein